MRFNVVARRLTSCRMSWCAPGRPGRPPSSSRSPTRCSPGSPRAAAVDAADLPPARRRSPSASSTRCGPGYAAAAEAARAHGYEPVLRLPGGHAAAYHRESLGIDVVWALDDPVPGTHDRFRVEGERLAGALRRSASTRAWGRCPGEYCPGAYSVNARGRVKLIGTAQRLVRGAALLGALIVVRDGAGVRDVLRDVYEELELAGTTRPPARSTRRCRASRSTPSRPRSSPPTATCGRPAG